MLELRSFDFTQEKEMNEVLGKHLLAKGASVFVSEGKIILPIENGEPRNTAQIIISLKEQKNNVSEQIDVITQSQHTLEVLREEAHKRLDEAQANLDDAQTNTKGKDKYDALKALTEIHKISRETLSNVDMEFRRNAIELRRLVVEVEFFDKKITELSK